MTNLKPGDEVTLKAKVVRQNEAAVVLRLEDGFGQAEVVAHQDAVAKP